MPLGERRSDKLKNLLRDVAGEKGNSHQQVAYCAPAQQDESWNWEYLRWEEEGWTVAL
jgi:hypothetical protein